MPDQTKQIEYWRNETGYAIDKMVDCKIQNTTLIQKICTLRMINMEYEMELGLFYATTEMYENLDNSVEWMKVCREEYKNY